MNAISKIDNLLVELKPQINTTISQYSWSLVPESQLQGAKTQLTKSDYIQKIAESDMDAVKDAIVSACILGVDLTLGKNQAWLLPRKSGKKGGDGKYPTIIVLQVGYKGVEAIYQEMGVIDRISVRARRENDSFEWSGDDKEKPIHTADWMASDKVRGKITGAFCITYFPDKTHMTTVVGIDEIYEKHRNISDGYKTYIKKITEGKYAFEPPWVSHEKAMIEKTMAFIASKQWPANIRSEKAREISSKLQEIDYSDYKEAFTKYGSKQKEMFNKLIAANDPMGLYLIQKSMDIESYIDMFNDYKKTIPRGDKDNVLKVLEANCTLGGEMVASILKGLNEDDSALVLESCEDIGDDAKYLLWNHIPKQMKEKLAEYMKLVQKEME